MKTTILLCVLTTILCVNNIEASLVSHEYTMIHSKVCFMIILSVIYNSDNNAGLKSIVKHKWMDIFSKDC